jgi:hypothetical protein
MFIFMLVMAGASWVMANLNAKKTALTELVEIGLLH